LVLPQWPGPSSFGKWGKASASKLMPLRPTPELEIGLRSIGKSTGGVVQYRSRSGIRLGGGLYFTKIAPGTPPARQAMLVFEIPLPF
jgi:hypothetical protein